MSDSSSHNYRGVVPPMITPFTTDGAVDVPAARRIIDHLIAGRASGVFVLGTTGEAASIPDDQKTRLVATMTEHVGNRAIKYAGISGNCFRQQVDAANEYRKLGADALVAHVPYYFSLNEKEIEAYFLRLADSISLPLVLYNIPSTTHHSIALSTLEHLMRHRNIVAIKDSAGDVQRLTDLLKLTGGRDGFPVLLGSSATYWHGLKHGAIGLVPSGAHLVPEQYHAMYIAAMEQNWSEVDRLQKETDAVVAQYLKAGSLGRGLAVLKALLENKGLCGRTMLSPLQTFVGTPG
jgi:4-hydroxy-tetrahydrodipicolinate synthase